MKKIAALLLFGMFVTCSLPGYEQDLYEEDESSIEAEEADADGILDTVTKERKKADKKKKKEKKKILIPPDDDDIILELDD